MEPNQTSMKPKTSAKDFFLNLGAFVALYTIVIHVLNLLFTVINSAYPPILDTYSYYYQSQSISWPVAILIVFFPIFILLQWILAKQYTTEPEKKNVGIRRWLTYVTLFLSGLTLAIDLATVLYYFIDGQDLTAGFLLKVLAVFVTAGIVFFYYISDIRRNLTSHEKKSWIVLAAIIIVGSIAWGFFVLGSPRTQQLLKYDAQKVSDLQIINDQVQNFYNLKGYLPATLTEIANANNYSSIPVDSQTGAQYEYKLVGQSAKAYQLCATFNKASPLSLVNVSRRIGYTSYDHPAGHACFNESIPVNMYPPVPKPM